MPRTTERPPWPPLTKKGEPRKKRGPKPKAPHEKEWKKPKAIVRHQVSYSKKRRQDVLLWMINHRIEDVEENSGARLVEKEPRKMPDGSEKWFRGPTSIETADFWKIPRRTIANWWKDREKIFDGIVPESAIPLVHLSQRNRPKAPPAPPAPRSPAADPPTSKSHPAAPPHARGIAPVPLPASGLHRQQPPGPRLASESVVYPQAVRASGPPLHPLYRADYALIEVAEEMHRLIQNQHNVHPENLLRVTALSQALVNDLTEAHKVLLDPQSYPQYYPPAATHSHHPQPQPQPQPQPPKVGSPPQLARPLSRAGNVRFTITQPASTHAHSPTSFRTPQVQTLPQKRQKRQPPTRPGLHEGQFIWRLASTGQQPLQTAQEISLAVAEQKRKSLSLKRGYNSTNGPGGTVEAPTVVEDEGVGRAGIQAPTRHDERRSNVSDARGTIDEDTAVADRISESDVSDDDVGDSQASDGSSAQENVGSSIDRRGKPSADADVAAQSDANTTEQSPLNASEHSLENEPLSALEAADADAEKGPQEGDDQFKVREDSHDSSHIDIAAVESVSGSPTADQSTIDEQPAVSLASAEGSVDEQERQEH